MTLYLAVRHLSHRQMNDRDHSELLVDRRGTETAILKRNSNRCRVEIAEKFKQKVGPDMTSFAPESIKILVEDSVKKTSVRQEIKLYHSSQNR